MSRKECKQTCSNCEFLGSKKSQYRTWRLPQHDVAACAKGHDIRADVYYYVCRTGWVLRLKWYERLNNIIKLWFSKTKSLFPWLITVIICVVFTLATAAVLSKLFK